MKVTRPTCGSRERRLLQAGVLVGVLVSAVGAALPGSPDMTRPEAIFWGVHGTAFQQPHGIALDAKRGEIVVANTAAHKVEILSMTGRSLARFVHRVPREDGTLADGLPRCVALDSDGRYLIADQLARDVDVVDRAGRSIGRIPIDTKRPGSPGAIHVSANGDIWVGGPNNDDRVYRFDSSRRPRSVWGTSGRAPGQLHAITAIAALSDSEVAVACAETELAIQIFSWDGTYRRGYGLHDLGPGNFSLPSGIALTEDGRVWISDELRQIVQIFDREGTYLGAFGGMGLGPGEFVYPSGLASDGRSRIAVAERESGRIQLLQVLEGGGAEKRQGSASTQQNDIERTRVEVTSSQKGETP